MDAPFTYVVKFWVDPKGADAIMHWLDCKHTADVVAQPGFRWVRRVRFITSAFRLHPGIRGGKRGSRSR